MSLILFKMNCVEVRTIPNSPSMRLTTIHPRIRKSRALWIAALAVLSLGMVQLGLGQDHPVPGATEQLDLNQYRAELDRWSVAVGQLADHREEATKLRQELPKAWTVAVDDQRFEVPTDWLRSALESLDKDPKAPAERIRNVQSRLSAMRREAEELKPASAGEAATGQARQTLNEILARREFRGIHGPTWWDRLEERLYRWLADALDRFGHRLASYPSITRVVFWSVLLLAAGALLVWMVQRLLRPAAALRLDLAAAAPGLSSYQQMVRLARQAAARAEYREAIRLAYWAGIHRLGELGLWNVDLARTHREYLRMLSPAQPQWKALEAVTRQFEFAWYARRPLSEGDFNAAMVHLEELGCAFRSTRATERF